MVNCLCIAADHQPLSPYATHKALDCLLRFAITSIAMLWLHEMVFSNNMVWEEMPYNGQALLSLHILLSIFGAGNKQELKLTLGAGVCTGD